MRGGCFTLDGSLSIPATKSGIKCCLDWRVDKNSSLSEHRRLYQVKRNHGRRMGRRRGGRGRMNEVRREGRVDERKEDDNDEEDE